MYHITLTNVVVTLLYASIDSILCNIVIDITDKKEERVKEEVSADVRKKLAINMTYVVKNY